MISLGPQQRVERQAQAGHNSNKTSLSAPQELPQPAFVLGTYLTRVSIAVIP